MPDDVDLSEWYQVPYEPDEIADDTYWPGEDYDY